MLPWEVGKGNTVYAYFTRWRREGGWAPLREALRQVGRRRLGRQPTPSAGARQLH